MSISRPAIPFPSRVWSDELLRNSLYLMLASGTTAALGFLFWLVAAHWFTAPDVGTATSLISATALISYISQLGMDTAIVRFVPGSSRRDSHVTTGLVVAVGAAAVLATVYAMSAPAFAPRLAGVLRGPGVVVFVVLTVCCAANLLTDAVFVACRATKYTLLADGVVLGATKLALPFVTVGLGAMGIFVASGVAAAAAVGFSLAVMVRTLGYRPRGGMDLGVVRAGLRFSSTSYLASLLNLLPILVLPILVLGRLGAAAAGYYYLAFQIANLVNAIGYAVSQTLLAEAAYPAARLPALLRRSALLSCGLLGPPVLLLVFGSSWVLMVFGADYSANAAGALRLFAIASFPVALNCWLGSALRLTRQFAALTGANAVSAVATVGLAAATAGRGVSWVAASWLVGNCLGAVPAATALARRAVRGGLVAV
jgi:O-antigen/teichoic acid export membrane protein